MYLRSCGALIPLFAGLLSHAGVGQSEMGNTTMAWESRQRGGRYYTRSRRVNGKVVREYLGCGKLAEIMAEFDADMRADQEHRRHSWQVEREDFEELDEQVKELDQACTQAMRRSLEEAGAVRAVLDDSPRVN